MKKPSPRKAIGKRLRFEIFARDGFTCRYCGRQSDVVPLHVDHVIPVCQGGTNDPENLVAACEECNLGKSGRTPTTAAPTEQDRLRLAQEHHEQAQSFEALRAARESRERAYQELVNYWCNCTGRDSADKQSTSTVFGYVSQFDAAMILAWIDKAARKCPWSDKKMGQYISGIRRMVMKEAQDAQ